MGFFMNFLAFDLGGSSGKLILGSYESGKFSLTSVHQFENHPVIIDGNMYWDFLHIYQEMCRGIKKAVRLTGDAIFSIGFDSFCNDFALVARDGQLLCPIRCYRDSRTEYSREHTYSIMSPKELYQINGNQNALFNTLMQLDAMYTQDQEWLLQHCYKLLFLSDYFIYLLTGKFVTEYTTASVTQMFDFAAMDWSETILQKFRIRKSLFAPIVMPGTVIGRTADSFNRQIGSSGFQVTSVCQHDTASAFLAAQKTENCAIISCGTWCLVGTEVDRPIISEAGFRYNIANEGGYPGHHRLLRNVMGTWILQEVMRQLKETDPDITYGLLDQEACRHPCFLFIDVDQPVFYQPGKMIEKIQDFCMKYYQKKPESAGELVSCIYYSLALKYRWCLEKLAAVTGHSFSGINMIGGGSNSRLMCQITSDVCGLPVTAGPADATSAGNLLVQMLAAKAVSSLAEGREILSRSLSRQEYFPESQKDWNRLFQQFVQTFHLDTEP